MTNTFPSFAPTLLFWWAKHKRDLPWKNSKDPYAVWLSEIILQQTRVEQGLPYFLRFLEAFPTVKELADAPTDKVMHLWEGLGYYSRARNLHHTARHIVYDLGGIFPHTYDELKKLKGVGDYTAAAIASFSYNLPYAVVDGNVYRVLSRIFGIDTAIDSPEGKRQFAALAQQLLPTDCPADFNQAMMDFGATCCTPANPNCHHCPFQATCVAYQTNKIELLPLKQKKIARITRYFTYLLIHDPNWQHVLIRQRTDKDIWQELYEFPMIESPYMLLIADEIRESTYWQTYLTPQRAVIQQLSTSYQQILTHRHIVAQFCEVEISDLSALQLPDAITCAWADLGAYAFPKIIHQYRTTHREVQATLVL